MGLGSSKPARPESEVEDLQPRDPTPQLVSPSSTDVLIQPSQASSQKDNELGFAMVDIQPVPETTSSPAADNNLSANQAESISSQARLAVLRQAALRSALEKRRREAIRSSQQQPEPSSQDSLSASATAHTSLGHAEASSSAGARHPLKTLGTTSPRDSAEPSKLPKTPPSSTVPFLGEAHQLDIVMEMASMDSSSSELSINDESSGWSPSQVSSSHMESQVDQVLPLFAETSTAAIGSSQHRTSPLHPSSSRDMDESNSYEDMEIDEGYSEPYEEHPNAYAQEDYLYEVQRLLAWGMPPLALLSHGVDVYDIRRVLLPYYQLSPPLPPDSTPPKSPLPPSETNTPSARLTIHSQYKPPSPKITAGSNSPSPPPVRRPAAAVHGHAIFGNPLSRASVTKPHPGKQKNWDRPTEQAPVVLRYESRSPSPVNPSAAVASQDPEVAKEFPSAATEDGVVESSRNLLMDETTSASLEREASELLNLVTAKATVSVSPDDPTQSLAQASRMAALQSLRARKGTPGLRNNASFTIDGNAVDAVVGKPHVTPGQDTQVLLESTNLSSAPVDMGGPEDGEISDSSSSNSETREEITLPNLALSAPSRPLSRGHKRPVASDFEGQPTSSLLSDALKRSRKKTLFGGAARRAAQLLIELSDSSDDDALDGPAPENSDRSRVGSEVEASRRMLADKEAEIRIAKDKLLAAIQRKRTLKQALVSAVEPSARLETAESNRSGRVPLVTDSSVLAVVVDGEEQHQASESEAGRATGLRPSVNLSAVQRDLESSVDHHHNPSPDQLRQTQPSKNESPSSHKSSSFFTPYHSILAQVPQVGYPPLAGAFGFALDEHLLSSIVLTRIVRSGNSVRLCAFELNGGVCSDPSCQELHLGRDVQISDLDLIAYLSRKTRGNVSPAQLEFAVNEARRNQPNALTTMPISATSAITNLLADVVTILGLV